MVRRGRGEIGKAVITIVPGANTTSLGAAPAATGTGAMASLAPSPLQHQCPRAIPDTTTSSASRTDHASVREDGKYQALSVDTRDGEGNGDSQPMSRASYPPRKNAVAREDDVDDGVEAFEAALDSASTWSIPRVSPTSQALCERKGNDAAVEALRPLFSAAAQRNTDARTRRDALEDKCNQLAAENEAVASELATQRAEAAKALATKQRMEKMCREQAQANQRAVEQAKAAAAGEQARMVELREKFETAVPSIEQKLSLEAERRRAQHEENEMLRAKLEAFMTQTSQSEDHFADQLTPGSLRIQIAKAECNKQVAERRAIDMRTEILRADLRRVKEAHAKMKQDTVERERFLTKVQSVWNERKKTITELEVKVDALHTEQGLLQAECSALREAATKLEAARSLEKLVGRLKGLCLQLEPDVKVKREEVIMLNAGTESNTAPEPDKCDGTEAMTSVV